MATLKKQKKKKYRVVKVILDILLIFVLLLAAFVAILTLNEYKPADVEDTVVYGEASQTLKQGDSVKIMSWNIGYGALGDNADFFMDGGKSVKSSSEERIVENLNAIINDLKAEDADIYFLQEVDVNSSRSYKINEEDYFVEAFDGKYQGTFANNYKCMFVPYPMPPLGEVNAGIITYSSYELNDSQRISLPCPFKWPVRMLNLKRCLLVSRIDIEGSDKELVIINLHLEAYDNGEGKAAQTQAMLEVMEEERAKGNYVIAGGDFNQTFSNVDTSAYPMLEGEDLWQAGAIDAKDFGDSWTLVMDNKAPTCRSLDKPLEGADKTNFQYYMIDGYIVSDNLDISSVRTKDLGFVNSDHNPVIIEVTLK